MGDCICVRRGDGPEGCGICNETGTTPDIAGLCERLRRPGLKSAAEAADTLKRQAAEIERMRGARRLIYDAMVATKACGPEDLHVGRVQAYSLCLSAIDAALTGEDACIS